MVIFPYQSSLYTSTRPNDEKETEVKLFESKKVRTLWNEENEKWYLSIIDAIAILIENPNPGKYRSVLKTRLKAERSELATNCSQLKIRTQKFLIQVKGRKVS